MLNVFSLECLSKMNFILYKSMAYLIKKFFLINIFSVYLLFSLKLFRTIVLSSDTTNKINIISSFIYINNKNNQKLNLKCIRQIEHFIS